MPQVPPMNAADAVRILQSSGMGGFDPVRLSSLRGARRDELADRMARDSMAGDRNAFATDKGLYDTLTGEMNADPYTGTAAHARVASVEDALQKAALETSPEFADVARTKAQQNAFGSFLNRRAGYEADITPEGDAALDAASARKIAENSAHMDPYTRSILLRDDKDRRDAEAGIKPQAQERQAMQALADIKRMAPQLLSRLREQNPGIDQNPGQFGGVMDTIGARVKRFAYDAGLYQRDEDIGQLEQLMRVIAARPYMAGRPNQTVYKDIMSHLGEFGFSPGADYARIEQILKMVPELEQAVIEGAQELPNIPNLQRGLPGQNSSNPGGGLPPGVTVTRR